MKLNIPEFMHYVIGGIGLIFSWQPIMTITGNIYYASAAFILWYIIMDQILHVVVKGEKINIIQ